MKKYKQLTVEQSYQIEVLIHARFNQTKIAAQLGFHRCSIGRELKRSIPKCGRVQENIVLQMPKGRPVNDISKNIN